MEASGYEKIGLRVLLDCPALTPSREGLRLDVRLVSVARVCLPRYTRRASLSLSLSLLCFPPALERGVCYVRLVSLVQNAHPMYELQLLCRSSDEFGNKDATN